MITLKLPITMATLLYDIICVIVRTTLRKCLIRDGDHVSSTCILYDSYQFLETTLLISVSLNIGDKSDGCVGMSGSSPAVYWWTWLPLIPEGTPVFGPPPASRQDVSATQCSLDCGMPSSVWPTSTDVLGQSRSVVSPASWPAKQTATTPDLDWNAFRRIISFVLGVKQIFTYN